MENLPPPHTLDSLSPALRPELVVLTIGGFMSIGYGFPRPNGVTMRY
jgi:hypothetical protein